MSNIGIIEYHGPKQILNVNDTLTLIENDNFIPQDKVYLDSNNKPILSERIPQAVIGIVKNIYKGEAYLYIINFGPNCKFRPKVINKKYLKGDRLVLWLDKNGDITIHSKYSSEPIDDVKCLLDMYSLIKNRPHFSEIKQNHNYTINEIINHDNLDTFTIDPKSSVDFDDAISVDVLNNTIYIHIVDIANETFSHNGNIKLRERCLTLYLSNEHTEHLLDEIDASENLSLIVNKQRKVITVKIKLNQEGLVDNYDIYKSTIIVKKRWNYEEVLEAINNKSSPESINYLVNLTYKRNESVNYTINLPSIRILSNKNGEIETFHKEESNDISHTLVATSMILANLVVSKHLSSKNIKIPNRFHDKLRGFKIPEFQKTGNESVDSFILIKKFAKACYSVDNKGHFGLGITDYVHFTSPMRRYADVLIHRILAGYINENLEEEVIWINQRATLVRSCQDIYINWKIIRWIKKIENLNNIYEIWITGIHKSGILWFMPTLSINGFIHIASIKPKQIWNFDNDKLIGNITNQILKVGDKLNSKIYQIDEITNVIYLDIIQ